jgi:hypothetical protein
VSETPGQLLQNGHGHVGILAEHPQEVPLGETRQWVGSVATTEAVRVASVSNAKLAEEVVGPSGLSTTCAPSACVRTACALPLTMMNRPTPPFPWVTIASR